MSRFHRVIDEFMLQAGDITKGDGTGGESIYGGEFDDENLDWREIDKEGLVCMANRGKATNSSQYETQLSRPSGPGLTHVQILYYSGAMRTSEWEAYRFWTSSNGLPYFGATCQGGRGQERPTFS